MKANMGTLDRTIRIILAVVIAALCFCDRVSGVLAIVLGVIAAALLITSCFAYCPLYRPLGLSTRQEPGASQD